MTTALHCEPDCGMCDALDEMRANELSEELRSMAVEHKLRRTEPAEATEFLWCVETILPDDWDIIGAGQTRVEALRDAIATAKTWDEDL